MFQLGMFPPKVVTFESDYGGTTTISTNFVSIFFDVLIIIFWAFITIKCFKCNWILASIGATIRLLSVVVSIYIGFVYLNLIDSAATYDDVIAKTSICNVLGYVSWMLTILGIILLVAKSDISLGLKISFAVYPVVRLIAVNGLGGYVWYPWIELIYAVGLLVWSLKESNNKHNETKHAW